MERMPFEWPDIKEWTEKDFAHIRIRFHNCKNLFATTEYGLLLFYSNHLTHNQDVKKLLQALFDLAKSYLKKLLLNDDKEHYILYFRTVLANAFHIADNRKKNVEIYSLYKDLIRLRQMYITIGM